MGTHGQFQIHLRGMALLLNNNEIKRNSSYWKPPGMLSNYHLQLEL